MTRSPAKPSEPGAAVYIEPVNDTPPTPGFYRVKLVKGGPWVACSIEHGPSRDPETDELLDRSWHWSVWIDGKLRADPSPDWRAAFGNDSAWSLIGERIDAKEYEFMLADADWAKSYAPNDPKAKPTKPIDPLTVPLPF